MDPSTGKQLLGTPELPLINSATAQLCKRYQIPFGYGTGGVTDSIDIGVQAGLEKTLTTLLGALGGVEVIHDGGSGLLGSARVISYEQLILDNELCGMIRHVLKGIEVSDKTLALDAIKEVGPGGDFLMSDHTVQNLREAVYLSQLWDRDRPSTPSGLDQVLKTASARVKEILDSHQPTPLDQGKVGEMERILRRVGLEKVVSMI
jgi:trimethylamine--corrinoid protein Co-methyltransferase